MMVMAMKYKNFKFTDVFEYERGSRYKREDHILGEVPYISSSAKNNGIDAYVTPPLSMKIYKEKLTLANSGSVGYCFYHPYEFVASDHVMVIWLKNYELTNSVALYLKPIFEKIKYKYSFGREINKNRLLNEVIRLPIDDNEKPNWTYMSNYINNLYDEIKFKKIYKLKNNQLKLDIKKWKEFQVGQVFKLEKGKCSNRSSLSEGELPYIGATNRNNGYLGFVDAPVSLITQGNCITFVCDGEGSIGYSNYQEENFVATINVISGRNENLNKYSGLFISAISNKVRYRYSFGFKRRIERLKKETLLLPVTDKGELDWEFMEQYIKSITYGNFL